MMTAAKRIRVLLVDDHFVVRTGLATSLGLEEDIDVVGSAGTVEQALEMSRQGKIKAARITQNGVTLWSSDEPEPSPAETEPDASAFLMLPLAGPLMAWASSSLAPGEDGTPPWDAVLIDQGCFGGAGRPVLARRQLPIVQRQPTMRTRTDADDALIAHSLARAKLEELSSSSISPRVR